MEKNPTWNPHTQVQGMHVTTKRTFVFRVLLACKLQSSTYRSPERFCEFCIKLYQLYRDQMRLNYFL
jgi:hypothetical protein